MTTVQQQEEQQQEESSSSSGGGGGGSSSSSTKTSQTASEYVRALYSTNTTEEETPQAPTILEGNAHESSDDILDVVVDKASEDLKNSAVDGAVVNTNALATLGFNQTNTSKVSVEVEMSEEDSEESSTSWVDIIIGVVIIVGIIMFFALKKKKKTNKPNWV